MEETTNIEEALISEWTTAVEALDSDSIKELFDIRPDLLWTPLTPLSHLETDFSHIIQRLEEHKLLGISIRPVYALHHILYDYGVPNDEWAPERIELVDFILKRTKGDELNTCFWGAEQNTVMHLAYFINQPDLIQHLKEYGALADIPNKSGHLPSLTATANTKEAEGRVDSAPVLLLNNTKSKTATLKDRPQQLNASDRFKRLRELAESPNANNRPLTERQNSTRRYFRPGHLEERKRRVLSEEEEAELEKQKLKRQKDIEQLAQRSAVKNNPLFKKFEEQQQQQQQTKRTPSISAASAVRDRKRLLGAADQTRRSSRVINSLKDRSYVSTSVFRQAQEAEAAAAAASGRSLKTPTLAQLRGGSPIAQTVSPNISDGEEEDEEKYKLAMEAESSTLENTEEIVMSTIIEETKKQPTNNSIINDVSDELSEARDTPTSNNKRNDPTEPPKSERTSNNNNSGVTEDEIESPSIGKLGDREISSNLKMNNKKGIEINSSKVKEITNMHEHLNDEEEIEINSVGKKFAVWKKNGSGQEEEEEEKTRKFNKKSPSGKEESHILNNENNSATLTDKQNSSDKKDYSTKEKILSNKPTNDVPVKEAKYKDQASTSIHQESSRNKIKEESSHDAENSYATGKKWSADKQSVNKAQSPASIDKITSNSSATTLDIEQQMKSEDNVIPSTSKATNAQSKDKSAIQSPLTNNDDIESNLTASSTQKKTLSTNEKGEVIKEEANYQPTAEEKTLYADQPISKINEKTSFAVKVQPTAKIQSETKSSITLNGQASSISAVTDDQSAIKSLPPSHTQYADKSLPPPNIEYMKTSSSRSIDHSATDSVSQTTNKQYISPSKDVPAATKDLLVPTLSAKDNQNVAKSESYISSGEDTGKISEDSTYKKDSTPTNTAYTEDDKYSSARTATSNATKQESESSVTSSIVKKGTPSIPIVVNQSEFNHNIVENNNNNNSGVTSNYLSKNYEDMILTPNDEEDEQFDVTSTYHNSQSIDPTTKTTSTSTTNTYLNTTTYNTTNDEKDQQQPNHVLHLEINTNKSQMMIDEESDEDEATTPTMANFHTRQQQPQQPKKKAIAEESDDDEESRHEWKSAYDQLMSNQQEMEFEDDVLSSHNKTLNKSDNADDRLSFSSDMDETSILKTLNYQNEACLDTWNVGNHVENEESSSSSEEKSKKRQSGSQHSRWSNGIQHTDAVKKRGSIMSKGGDSVAASSEAGSEQWFDPDDGWNEQQEEMHRQSLLATGFHVPPHEDYAYKKQEEEEGYKRHSDSSINTNSETYSNKNSNSTENTNHDEDDEDRKYYRQEIEEEEEYDYYSTNLHNTSATTATTTATRPAVEEKEDDYYSTNLHKAAASASKMRGESSYYHGGPADHDQEQEEGEIVVFMDQFSSPAVQEVKSREMQKSTSQQSADIATAFFNNSAKPVVAQHQAPKPLTAATITNFSSSSLSVNQIHRREDDEISLIKVPSRTIAIAEVGTQQEEVPHDPNHPRVEDISHYMNKLPAFEKSEGGMPGGSAFDAAALAGGLENESVVLKRAISTSQPNGAQPVEQNRGIPNAHEINFSMMAEKRFDEESHKISMSSTEASEFGKIYIGVSGAHNMLLPLPKEITYVRCVISDGEYEYMSRYEILGHQILMDYECVIDTRPGMIITVSLHVRPDYHVKPRTGWSKWLTSIRKQKEHLSGYVHPEDGAIGQTRFAVDHMVPGCYKKTYESHFDCFNSWYARTARERARREQFGDDEDFLKIIGRLNVEMLYLPVSNPSAQVPRSLRECDLTIKIRQWHDTCWQSGYLSTRRQGLKVWERHYYRLIGSQLIGYTSEGGDRQIWDHYNMSDVIRLSAAADKVLVTLTLDENDGKVFGQDNIHAGNHKGFFRLAFPDYYLDCVSDDLEESEEWVKTLKSMIGRVPLRLPFSD